MVFRKHAVILSIIASAALVACGGGGGSTAAPTASISGVAAVGAPLPNATVKLKGANGTVLTTTASATGAYTFADVSTLTAPMMLQASGTAGGVAYTLHSILMTAPAAGVSGVLNVTPATEAVMAQASGKDPAAVFAVASEIAKVTPVSLTDAKARVIAALTDVLTALGLPPTNVDLFTTAFTANGTGLDKLLDMIQFQSASNSSGGQDISVANKNTGAAVVITPTTVAGSVPKVVAPTAADVALNTATIKAFIDAFNANIATLTGVQSAAMADLIATDFLDNGYNKAELLLDLKAHAVGIKMQDYVLQGCNGATKICQVEISLLDQDGKTIEQFPMPVIQGSDDKWRAYGNRSPFDFDLKPVAWANYTISGDVANTPSVDVGFNFWFTGVIGNGTTRTYNSAQLYTRNDDSANWGLVASFKPKSDCNAEWLPIDNNSSDCSNVQSVDSDTANIINAARLAGKLKFKVIAYTNPDYSGTAVVHEQYVKKDLFTTTTGTAAITNSGMSITAADLGTNSVRFAGPVREVSIGVITPNSVAQGYTQWEDNYIAGLAGVATVAKANVLCRANGVTENNCNYAYGSTAVISSITLSKRDAQGRGLWVTYSKL
jgi:hypothetical protein